MFRDFIKEFLAGIFVIGAISGVLCLIDLSARRSLIQELCNRQQYDFCKVDKVFYKLKR